MRDVGGALAAPGWADVCDWWTDLDPASRLARDYALPRGACSPGWSTACSRRAVPTIGFDSGTHDHSRHGPRPGHVAFPHAAAPVPSRARPPLAPPSPPTPQENR